MKQVLAIVGPTAVGKTGLSIKIAQKFNGEIISGDSMQVYQGLDIGTAKIRPEEMRGVKHHLIDNRTVQETFSVSEFKKSVDHLVEEITQRGKLPIIVGGTGFYLQAVLDNLNLGGSDDATNKNRLKWQDFAKQHTQEELWNELNKVDSKSATSIPVSNVRRVVRALEVFDNTGHPFSEQENGHPKYDSLVIGLNTDRGQLYKRINSRVDEMINEGLEEEARWLYRQVDVKQANKGIGYREWPEYFESQQTLQETIDQIKLDSRHYAKRQLTWFRNKMDVNWFDLIKDSESLKMVESQIEQWRK
ncbi:tRNA (adenosine(37)-N6)-dimethylallyltransferase MiaA [Pediococcus argentinicus]|uniref:tRNA dimethylallyltransferase n=1 Tax=Pediococcus argentinicus TaxID=480391 RepID=A0A0R2NHW5_9LACO|nr:tRNA (adenosine(37)-N6)-dimethylallyltransferase MiaA [Pediococcus argentinicus]KRO25393.1 tRNA delta(2)-isopentenylpyrophosphate transferase [Pediococcus argentinicus]NKZ22311.1 tRNA (adenosine(37)-N6)-dimethylallyltransferase MiaA [Pediococcus argentinicus]GEP19324.1 tRNA dimethylallyltransferase [Pediococcus argentinicus]